MSTAKKVVLVTGGNSGLGFQCCLTLAKRGDVHVILAGRNRDRVQTAVESVKEAAASASVVEAGIVDLSSLTSTQEKRLTSDGFESTFGTNHLGHFLLISLLRERVTQRLVVISSETHDPSDSPGIAPADVSDIDQLAKGLEPFNAGATYGSSKLCNLLFAKEFARRFPFGPMVVAYTPGLTPGTGLFRDLNKWAWAVMKLVLRVFAKFTKLRLSTPEYSGGIMAKLAVDDPMPFGATRGDYIRVDEVYEASETARDPEIGRELWEKSEKWVSK